VGDFRLEDALIAFPPKAIPEFNIHELHWKVNYWVKHLTAIPLRKHSFSTLSRMRRKIVGGVADYIGVDVFGELEPDR